MWGVYSAHCHKQRQDGGETSEGHTGDEDETYGTNCLSCRCNENSGEQVEGKVEATCARAW